LQEEIMSEGDIRSLVIKRCKMLGEVEDDRFVDGYIQGILDAYKILVKEGRVPA
jgi:hypothetical protein